MSWAINWLKGIWAMLRAWLSQGGKSALLLGLADILCGVAAGLTAGLGVGSALWLALVGLSYTLVVYGALEVIHYFSGG